MESMRMQGNVINRSHGRDLDIEIEGRMMNVIMNLDASFFADSSSFPLPLLCG
jgi:hypothetical protein